MPPQFEFQTHRVLDVYAYQQHAGNEDDASDADGAGEGAPDEGKAEVEQERPPDKRGGLPEERHGHCGGTRLTRTVLLVQYRRRQPD